MTEQEAEAFAERLTRIWEPEEFETHFAPEDHSLNLFTYYGVLDEGRELEPVQLNIMLRHPLSSRADLYAIYSKAIDLVIEDGSSWWVRTRSEEQGDGWKSREEAFVERWLETLRRNCWLSGCDVEASMHEKTEWMRGFSCEEVEAWKLKM